ncbi:MAG: dinitrogenase iron-molybdenum cofactor [Alphaproteobacteria bacterium]|nr:MAG: dinitrogenase iron-molybdenum cofactor [Alphaproteobacteria bacterium]
MKIAIPTDNEYASPHFGRSPQFTIIEIKDNKVFGKELIDNPGHEPGLIPEFLSKRGVQCIISSGMGNRAIELFKSYDIEVFLGVTGKIDDIIKCFISGELVSGESTCKPESGKGYGINKKECDHK